MTTRTILIHLAAGAGGVMVGYGLVAIAGRIARLIAGAG